MNKGDAPKFKSPEWYELLYKALLADYGEAYKACQHCGHPTHVAHKCRNCNAAQP